MSTATEDAYYIPDGSHWPIIASIGLFLFLGGFAIYLNGSSAIIMIAGLCILVFVMFGWFGTVVGESERGTYNDQVNLSFRWGMGWFILSEVFFFGAFFGALYYARQLAVPWLGGEDIGGALTGPWLWPDYVAEWPTNGPVSVGGDYRTIPAFGLPFWNTIVLLSSGVTVTLAHHALKRQQRTSLCAWLLATVLLGFLFLVFQVTEFGTAYGEMNLTLATGIYGATFFMLTGFHGLHVTIGTIMLLIVLLRSWRGHFTPQRHFYFEATAWYWHFVDVVWLGLFIFVYWL